MKLAIHSLLIGRWPSARPPIICLMLKIYNIQFVVSLTIQELVPAPSFATQPKFLRAGGCFLKVHTSLTVFKVHHEYGRLCRYFQEKDRVASTPCSYSQELLLFNNELDPFNPVHNEAAWVRIRGNLDVPALSRAFRYLTDRHTVLQSHLYIAVGLY